MTTTAEGPRPDHPSDQSPAILRELVDRTFQLNESFTLLITKGFRAEETRLGLKVGELDALFVKVAGHVDDWRKLGEDSETALRTALGPK